eukprot:scaffold201556_cov28-Tisochrysis_lutea.AAC.4
MLISLRRLAPIAGHSKRFTSLAWINGWPRKLALVVAISGALASRRAVLKGPVGTACGHQSCLSHRLTFVLVNGWSSPHDASEMLATGGDDGGGGDGLGGGGSGGDDSDGNAEGFAPSQG